MRTPHGPGPGSVEVVLVDDVPDGPRHDHARPGSPSGGAWVAALAVAVAFLVPLLAGEVVDRSRVLALRGDPGAVAVLPDQPRVVWRAPTGPVPGLVAAGGVLVAAAAGPDGVPAVVGLEPATGVEAWRVVPDAGADLAAIACAPVATPRGASRDAGPGTLVECALTGRGSARPDDETVVGTVLVEPRSGTVLARGPAVQTGPAGQAGPAVQTGPAGQAGPAVQTGPGGAAGLAEPAPASTAGSADAQTPGVVRLPHADDGSLAGLELVADPSGTLHALGSSGERWRAADPGAGRLVAVGGSVVTLDPRGARGRDARDGSPTWEVAAQGRVAGALLTDGRVVVWAEHAPDGGTVVHAADAVTGALRWSLALPDGAEPVAAGGALYLRTTTSLVAVG